MFFAVIDEELAFNFGRQSLFGFANLATEIAFGGLGSHTDIFNALRLQPLRKTPNLRRFAGTVDAFECNEFTFELVHIFFTNGFVRS